MVTIIVINCVEVRTICTARNICGVYCKVHREALVDYHALCTIPNESHSQYGNIYSNLLKHNEGGK